MQELKHTYQYTVDLNADTAPARVIRMVGKNKKVLELGAGPGSITRHLKDAGSCRITALEVDESAIKILAPFCDTVYQANLNDAQWTEFLKNEGLFEVIVAADVLEHLYDPLAVLKKMSRLIDDGGVIVASVPHVGHSAIHACMLDEDFQYRDWGLLDRTHIRFFGIKNIQQLFEAAGLKIIEAEFVMRAPEQTEFADRWAKLSQDLRRALATNPFGSVYQIVVKAVPMSAPGEAITLIDVNTKNQPARRMDAVKTFMRPYLSAGMRTRILSIARRIGIKV